MLNGVAPSAEWTTKGIQVYSRGRYIALGATYRAGGLAQLIVPNLVS